MNASYIATYLFCNGLTVPFRRSQRYERYTAVKTIDIHEHAETIHFIKWA